MPDDPRQAYEEEHKKRREEFRQQHPIRAGAGDAAMSAIDLLRGLFVGSGQDDSNAAMTGELIGAGSPLLKAILPLSFVTRYKKFYHGSPNKFTKFKEGPIDPEFPVMPSPGSVYLNPDVRFATGSDQYPGWPNVYEANLHDINNVLDMGVPASSSEESIFRRYGQEGVDHYLREQEKNWKLLEDLSEEGVYPAPELRKRGIDAIRYQSGWGQNPRGYNIAVSDPNKVHIQQVLSEMVMKRIRRMHEPR